MIEIDKVINKEYDLDLNLLKLAIQLTLESLEKSDYDLTLRLTGDEEVKALNESYRGLAQATDVLSFNQDFMDPETGRIYLGDIIVSVERALAQANETSRTLNEECTLLAIHGTLHLLGFDHAEADEHQRMWKVQDELLRLTFEKYSGSAT